MPSQCEIAKKLNLSQATVSRALNNDRSLPLATKLRVKQLALKIGYERRPGSGRSLPPPEAETGRGSDRLLALVHHAPTLDGKYYSLLIEIIQGFIQAAAAQKITLIVKQVENMETARKVVGEYCNNVLGAVAILRYPADLINLFCDNFYCVSLNHRYDGMDIKVIEPQQETAFDRMCRYLYEQGHRKIGFLTVRGSYQFAFSRCAGYLQAAGRMAGCFRPEWMINVMPEEQLDLPEIIDRVAELHQKEQLSAFLCTSGSLAKSLIDGLARHHLRVPEDISLAAFDDILTPTADGHLLCGAQADYEQLAGMVIRVLRQPSAFDGVMTVGCDTAFHRGNTVTPPVLQV